MLAYQLISHHFPTVLPDDKVSHALQLMEDFDILNISVADHNKFFGIVSKDDLLDAEEDASLQSLGSSIILKSVKSNEHFLSALKLASQNNLSIVPVINAEQELLGSISCHDLVDASARFTGAEEPGGLIVLEMERKSYSFGEISRLVETNDAYITQCNTSQETETGLLIVTIRINKAEVSDILSTFQRYEYVIRHYFGEEQYENELRYNYDHLMSYLKI